MLAQAGAPAPELPAPPAIPACAEAPTYDPMPEGAGHDHASVAQHALGTSNLAVVGHLDPRPGAGPSVARPPSADPLDHSAGGAQFGELDVRGDRAYLAHIGAPSGVLILDVRDPERPAVVGEWRVPGGGWGYVTDVKASTDGRHFYASYQFAGPAVYVVDASDPRNPVTVDSVSVPPYGVHMLWVHALPDGTEWLYGATAYSGGVAVIESRVAEDGARELVKGEPFDPASAPHDVSVHFDPLLQRDVMVVANGAAGVRLLDLSDPGAPTLLGEWRFEGAERFYAHTVRAGIVEGRRIVLVSPEGGAAGLGVHSPARLWALDATDPSAIVVHGWWSNPGGHAAGHFTLSTHNFQWVLGKVYLAHYHGGVFVLDASTLGALREPRVLAHRLPADHAHGAGWPAPMVWDVVVSGGLTMAADIGGGLYVMRYACDVPLAATSYG